MKFIRTIISGAGAWGALTFLIVMGVTIYVTVEQRELAGKEDREKLVVELGHAKDHFRDILYSDITVANSMAVIYREYGFRNNFDSVAKALLGTSEYAQVVQLTVDGVITNVYPPAGYESTIGLNVSFDPLRLQEYNRAKEKKEIFFAGPRNLRAGGQGILGKVPVIFDDTVKALMVVLTKLDLIQKTMNRSDSAKNVFACELIKKSPGTDTTRYYLSKNFPSKSGPVVTTEIPEGDWTLSVSYAEGYRPPPFPVSTLLTGLAIALLGFFLVYRISNQNFYLGKAVREKTHDLAERIKELSTIYKVNTLLQNDHVPIEQLMHDIVNVLPAGWQYAEVCAARIIYDGCEYSSPGYKSSLYSQHASFKTIDDKQGRIEVAYTADKPSEVEGPFLKEERELLNTLADHILAYLNKRYNQESRARSEAQFRAGFEHAAIGMALVSLSNRWISVNHALCDMIGYSEDELVGTVVSDITHPDDREGDAAFVQRTISGEIDYYRKEKRYLHKNGTIVWIKLTVALIREKGEPIYFVGQIENMTEKLEADLKFQNLVEKSMVGVYILQNNRFVYVNPKIIEQSGYSETELLNMNINDFVHPEDSTTVEQNIKARVSGEIHGLRYEIRAHRKSGEMIWVEMFGNNTIYQGKPAIIGTMVNITDKKKTFNELVKSEANMKSIFDNTIVAYMLMDTQLNILSANQLFLRRYEKQSGIHVEIGDNFLDRVQPERKERIRTQFMGAVNSGKMVLAETQYGDNYFELTLSPIISEGKVIGLCYAGIEVTERKHAELERQNLLAERLQIIEDLTRRNRELEQFSYIISHNVRGPVATISGLTNIATGEMFSMEDRTKAMKGVQVTADNLDNVLKDLNEVISLRKGQQESKAEIQLPEKMEIARLMLKDLIDKYQPVISCSFEACPTVYGISSYVQNIVYNMLGNAIKYARPNTIPEIEVWTEVRETHVELHFRDKGLGIDLERHSEHLFGLYKRFHMASDGKGMGLFMTKTQMEAMNGSVTVESSPNQGAHFILHFRRADATL